MKVSRASCRTVDPTEDGRAARSEQRPRMARADVVDVAPTSRTRVPSLRSIAATLPAPAEAAGRERHAAVAFDRAMEEVLAPPVSGRRRRRSREWCVDHGVRIDTMSTFELWIAIASREVLADVRVWREGMECWTPVAQLPELACAVTDPRSVEAGFEGTGALPTVPAAQMPDAHAPAQDASAPQARASGAEADTSRPQDGWTRATTPEDPPPSDELRSTHRSIDRRGATPRRTTRVANRHLLELAMDETLDLTSPRIAVAPCHSDTTPGPTASTVAPASAVQLRRRPASGAPWVALGTAVGILAIGVASLASPSRSTPPAPVARTGIAPAMPAPVATPGDGSAEPIAPEVAERLRRPNRSPQGSHRDPGQHRLRRSN